MAINLVEALYLLQQLNVQEVEVNALIDTFLRQETKPTTEQELPPLEEPPLPPGKGTQPTGEVIYGTYKDAKKAATKGQRAILHDSGKGYILI